MMIGDSLQRLQDSHERIKLNVACAYGKCEEKGAILPAVQNSECLAQTIESIPQVSSEWSPQADWWDIDRILEEDTEDYPGKVIVLLTDFCDTIDFSIGVNGCAKIRTSDGAEYVSSATHLWDKSKDKVCALGYNTRFFIGYFSNVFQKYKNTGIFDFAKSPLYIVFKNLDLEFNGRSNYGFFHGCRLLECVSFINSTLNDIGNCLFYNNSSLRCLRLINSVVNVNYNPFYGCASLSYVDGIKFMDGVTDMNAMFGSTKMKEIPGIDTSNIRIFQNAFSNALIQRIECIDFFNASNVFNMFQYAFSLFLINHVSNIRISGLSFSACALLNRDTLLRILEALYDFSADTEGTHTIVLGATNLAKLSDEEIAVGQDKGWTIS